MTATATDPRHWNIGLVGYGEVGRILAEDLRKQDVKVAAYDTKLRSDQSGAALRLLSRELKKGRPTFVERPVGEVLRGGGKILYIEGGAGFALGCCGAAPVVFVIRRTFTRRLAARPSRVLFSSTGLSLPSPIT